MPVSQHPTPRIVTKVVSRSAIDRPDYLCDGTADDVQIQAAIDAANTAGGGIVFVKEGVYTLAAAVRVKSGIHLQGEGWKTILTIPSGVDINAVENYNPTSGNTDIVISDLAVDGTYDETHTTEKAGIRLYRVTNAVVTRCRVFDIYGIGISVTKSDDSANSGDRAIITDNVVTTCLHHNISLDGGLGIISGNTCDTTTNYDNIQVDGTSGVTVTANTCKNAGRHNIMVHSNPGSDLTAVENVVSSNTCKTAGTSNIVLTADSVGENAPRNIAIGNYVTDATSDGIRAIRASNSSVIGNIVHDSGRYGIYLDTSPSSVVGNNTSSSNTGTGGRGIYAVSSDNSSITANICESNAQQGIELSGCDYCTVSGNVCNLNTTTNIRLTNSTNNVVSNNQCNNGTMGIEETGTSDNNSITDNSTIGNSIADLTTLGASTAVLNTDATSNAVGRTVLGLGTGSTVQFTKLGSGVTPASPIHAFNNDTAVGVSAGVTIQQSGSGDAVIQFQITGVRRWVAGIDNSDSDKFKISATEDVGATALMTMTTDGDTTFVGTTTTPKLQITETAYFDAEVDDGNSGTADTINWSVGNNHKTTLNGDCTYTFTAPAGVSRLGLKIVHSGAGRNPTWPATVKWAGGAEPTWTGTDGAIDIATFYYDGTNYYGVASLGFA